MSTQKRSFICLVLAGLTLFLSGCAKTPTDEQRYRKLIALFTDAGYSCALSDPPPDTPVGIYNASVWKTLKIGEETVMVYFDESNRADYLITLVDPAVCDLAVDWGQRFILTYNGDDETLIAFLQALSQPD